MSHLSHMPEERFDLFILRKSWRNVEKKTIFLLPLVLNIWFSSHLLVAAIELTWKLGFFSDAWAGRWDYWNMLILIYHKANVDIYWHEFYFYVVIYVNKLDFWVLVFVFVWKISLPLPLRLAHIKLSIVANTLDK